LDIISIVDGSRKIIKKILIRIRVVVVLRGLQKIIAERE